MITNKDFVKMFVGALALVLLGSKLVMSITYYAWRLWG